MRFSVLVFKNDIWIELQAPVIWVNSVMRSPKVALSDNSILLLKLFGLYQNFTPIIICIVSYMYYFSHIISVLYEIAEICSLFQFVKPKHACIAFLLRDIDKQYRPRPVATEHDIWSNSSLFTEMIFHYQNLSYNDIYQQQPLKRKRICLICLFGVKGVDSVYYWVERALDF